MKKTRNAVISLLTAALLVITSAIPMVVSASADTTVTIDAPVADAYLQGKNKVTDGDFLLAYQGSASATTADSTYVSHAFFKYDLSDVMKNIAENIVVKSVKFIPYVSGKTGATDVGNILFWHISEEWDESSFDATPADMLGYAVSGTEIEAAPDAVLASYDKTLETNKYNREEYDITDVFYAHMANDAITDKADFSFVISCSEKGSSTYKISSKEATANKTGTQETALPAALEIVYGEYAMLDCTKEVVPANPSDEMELTFNNTIKSANIQIDGNDFENVTIDGKKITINNDWQAFTNYTVSVDICDIYNQKFNYTYVASIDHDVEIQKQFAEKTLYVTDDLTAECKTGRQDIYSNTNQAVLIKLPLPVVEAGTFLEKYVHTVHFGSISENNGHNFYLYDGDDVTDITTFTYEDLSSYITEEYFIKEGIAAAITSAEGKINYYYENKIDLDLTECANKALKDGKEYFWIIYRPQFASEKSFASYSGAKQYSTTQIAVPYSNSTINTAPSVNFMNCHKNLVGVLLKEFSFMLTTIPADIATMGENVYLADNEGEVVNEATFVYNENTHTISLETPLTLEEETTYSVNIKSGVSDIFGNFLNGVMPVSEFTTGKITEFGDPTITDPSTGDTDNVYEDIETVTSLVADTSIKGAIKISNSSTKPVNAVLLLVTYVGDLLDEIRTKNISVGVGESRIYTTNAIEVSADTTEAKAFIWTSYSKPIPIKTNITITK